MEFTRDKYPANWFQALYFLLRTSREDYQVIKNKPPPLPHQIAVKQGPLLLHRLHLLCVKAVFQMAQMLEGHPVPKEIKTFKLKQTVSYHLSIQSYTYLQNVKVLDRQ